MTERRPVVAAVWSRLVTGAEEYGERSFQRPPAEIIGEVLEELLDVIGWAAIAWIAYSSNANVITRKDTAVFLSMLEDPPEVESLEMGGLIEMAASALMLYRRFSLVPKGRKTATGRAAAVATRCLRDTRLILQAVGHEPPESDLQKILVEALTPTLVEYTQTKIGEALGLIIDSPLEEGLNDE